VTTTMMTTNIDGPALALLLQEEVGGRVLSGIQHPDLSKFLVIGALLFCIGVAGVLVRRNIIVIFMSVELILNAANLNFIAFARHLQEAGSMNAVAGQVFTVFVIGVAGVLTRRNIIVIFMSVELILNAANLNFVAFSRYLQLTGNANSVAGQVFTVFIIVVAAAEAAIGLSIVIALYRNRETIFVDKIDLLKW